MRNRTGNRNFWVGMVALVALFVAAQIYAQSPLKTAVPEDARTAPLDQPVPVSPKLRTGQFANGLRYFIRENREPRNRAELRLVVRVGSIVEDDDQRGLAHFLEHMAFNGTANFQKQELVKFMESIGMRLGPGVNASTSFDETIYMLQLPTDSKENMAKAFQILEDWAHGLTLDPAEIDKERGVVIEEWRLGQGAGSRIRDKQFPILLKDSRYAVRLPIGTRESLETFQHEALRRFYLQWYRPELMGVIAVGDFNGADIEALVKSHFERLPATLPGARERVSNGVPEHQETMVSVVTDREIPQTSVTVYHKMPHVDDWTHKGYRDRLVEQLYTGMLNDRFAEIARRPGAPILGAGSDKGRLIGTTGAFTLSAGVPENGVEKGIETLFTEAARVARFGFTASELEREKVNTLRAIERAYTGRDNNTSARYASEYVRVFLYGESTPDIEYEFELYKRFMPTITLDEVNQVGRTWIRDANTVIAVTGPDKEGVKMPGEAALLAAVKSVDSKEITAYVDTVADQPLLASPPAGSKVVEIRELQGNVTEWKLGNGVRVVLKPTDFQTDQILFRGFSPGGTSLASDEDYIPASTAVAVIAGGGLGPFNVTSLQRVLAGKAANVSPTIGAYDEGFSGNASPKDLETLFQLIYLRFTAPRADAEFFEVFNTQNRRVLANRDASPATAFNDAFNRLITQNHLRARPATVATLDQTNLEKSLAFYKDRFSDASDYTFVFVGDLKLDVIRPLVEQYLGGLPSTGRKENWKDVGMRPPKGVVAEVVHKGVEPQSQTRIAFTGPIDYDRQAERLGIQAMAMAFQGRLRNILREELGGTYSVSVSPALSFRPQQTYTLTISFGSAPERYVELIQTIFKEIEVLKANGPTEAEVRDAREVMLRSFETSLRQNATWLNQFVSDYQRDEEPGAALRTYTEVVQALTPESLKKAAEKYFNMENIIQVTLLPER
jgi:zinc protease